MNLTERVLLTGGTGLLGKELTRRLLDDGYKVVTTTSSKQKATAEEFCDQKLYVFPVNFLDEKEIKTFEKFLLSLDRVDFLINNARSLQYLRADHFNTCSAEDLVSEFKINVAVPLQIVKTILQLRTAPKSIINISSQYSSVVPNQALYEKPTDMSPIQYNISKAALEKLTEELAVRLHPFQTRTNGIAYGGIKGRATDAFVARYEALAPHSRMLDVEDCYGTLKWLMSDESAPVNGQIITANAGWTLC